ncbi:hypothetical protein [uncultured Chryseobacterium sp.]|jgi:hypothetical protein|uniref:hypothetical protein n=1 Tax=uncultured Chryseobacterium sp. TaxID=259322 RepID=UPI002625F9BD|nr:hypothetical protein [uncultured Chryseobacterium sp.]
MKLDAKPTVNQVDEYSLLKPLFTSLLNEVKELSKKKPDEVINNFKAKTINKILERVKELLNDEPTSEFLEIIDIDTLPSNSDIVIIMVQFEASLNKFYHKYTKAKFGTRVWNNEED